ncbi:hypothetical protein HBI56_219570 [Parastagonospora nodorum]|uniref:Calcineurin-like phosphoesterase domain-containing protein n=2 Tax=Phaeosphaeria nodorum (strain SN15 / ATCC MYA-4574 / FGSC 10173) TaxID=321614 RepID=Q0V7G2_PHANO|nr:hypothetical protein SNOG_00052 [Parastagonospora nodorum SN15]KAH3920630.1 hypothetical protein HBH56_007420 [Parastagonospora nodorum]EAT91547.1 hypothetical protein SNOG_00052 [Parastagonospora nodorum SN15]KAH3922106.1 hypothetical protein HBH54_228360 [Parastagonospora nodorum]KAH3940271.1 hypothetical protein HBH53_219790 [Parastagonospora nodorum]KAH3960077.1 hypothetical protein HBH52_239330 [Parastagonospora nodorum]
MRLSRFFFTIAWLLAPVALISTTWLYLYPIFHGCAFPTPPAHIDTQGTSKAPFRLLALGDPQLEGDSSLPDPNAPLFPSLRWVVQDLQYAKTLKTRLDIVKEAAVGLITEDLWKIVKGKRKAIDLWGNDWYLAHIVRQTRWWAEPTHVSVLGDLLGSQWITDGEFEKRAGRYWNVVMRGLGGVPAKVYGMKEEEIVEEIVEDRDTEEAIAEESARGELLKAIEDESKNNAGDDELTKDEPDEQKQEAVDEAKQEEGAKPLRTPSWGGTTEVLGADQHWAKRVINIAGNHDVGYAGDLDISRVARFEKAFGSVNWDIWFTLPNTTADQTPPALRIVVLNSMNIDTPAWNFELQSETYSFMNHIITTARPVEDKTHATVLLTHIPLEKQPGICVDSPLFNYFDEGQGLREQNMLSGHSSKTILEGVFGMSGNQFAAGSGMGRRGIVLNGHDHEGCDTVHFIRQEGVNDGCNANTVKRDEAYWPTVTSTPIVQPIHTPAPESFDVSALNPFDVLTCPRPVQVEEPPPPEPQPTGWRAYPFPNRPFSITHDPVANVSSCTSIQSSPHIREITLRSMMGDFSGYAGFLSAWFDNSKGERGEWVFEFASCGVGIQHWWWGVHSVDFALVVMIVLGLVIKGWENIRDKGEDREGIAANGHTTKA